MEIWKVDIDSYISGISLRATFIDPLNPPQELVELQAVKLG